MFNKIINNSFLNSTMVIITQALILSISLVYFSSLAIAKDPVQINGNWDKVFLSPYQTKSNQPTVGVMALGNSEFAVAYIAPTKRLNIDKRLYGNTLYVREFDIANNIKGSQKLISNNFAGFVRGTMSPAMTVSDCPSVAYRGFKTSLTQGNLAFTGTTNFFVHDEYAHKENLGQVFLTRLLWCSGKLSYKTSLVDAGIKPSVAVGMTDKGVQQILVVYGQPFDKTVRGQFFNLLGKPLGANFVITNYSSSRSYLFSTDIIWNHASKRFIVGFMTTINKPAEINYTPNCSTFNTSVSLSGETAEVVHQGDCDVNGFNATPSWVDIDRRASVNPEGIYAWNFPQLTSSGGKRIYFMDKFGYQTGDSVNVEIGNDQFIFYSDTVPFAARREPYTSTTNPFIGNQNKLIQSTIPQYNTALWTADSSGWPTSDLNPRSFSDFPNNNLVNAGDAITPKSRLQGIGTLDHHTVYVTYDYSSANAYLTVQRNRDDSLKVISKKKN
ncbi:MAG: hypothetical protein ACC657_18425 [Thiohalomonadales bacterium]